ncbi:MAG TPA: peptidoglycan DD-metalloendopeptidase family protein, partial [Nostocaceae cyanobacterium]|nr:peptidoglycan DD-metalloendopeptidase family protein [Nostocaceae cyanobacterium]
ISVGATSLLVTRQSDQAQAAAPVGSQKAASTIPTVAETDMKFAATKLESQAASSASVPENPVVVEPTAVSQVPGLEAKWQIAGNSTAVQVPTVATFSGSTVADNQPVYIQPQAATGLSKNSTQSLKANQLPETEQKISHAGDDAGTATTAVIVPSNDTESSDVNVQLKAQQEFAINRLQEKSNRLRKSLAELRSEEAKNLPPNTIGTVEPKTVTKKQAATQLESPTETGQADLAAKLKQNEETSVAVQPLPTPAPVKTTVIASSTTTAYEVKPGDTLAAIARKHGLSVSELVRANNLNDPNQLKISQKLVIPTAKAENSTFTPAPVAQLSNSAKFAPAPVNNLPITSQLPVATQSSSVVLPTPVATEDPLPIAAQSTPVAADSFGVGGDSPVPVAFNGNNRTKKPAQKVARTKSSDRLRVLQAEIQRLREKYRAQQSGITAFTEEETANTLVPVFEESSEKLAGTKTNPQPTAIPIPVPRPVGNYNAQPVKPLFGVTPATNEPINPEFLPNQTGAGWNSYRKPSGLRLTVPPAGKTASDSLGRLRGTTVSPQLPPLAAVDQYLPKPIDENVKPPSNSSTVSYMWPAKGVLTSGYGWRWGRMHRGIDIANSTGTPIYAAADGVVEKAGWNNGGYGNLVDIRHPDGSMTRYGHNSRIMVQVGQYVEKGQQIAAMGSTGFSTGPHSHFEIHPTGKGAVNPIAFLPDRV